MMEAPQRVTVFFWLAWACFLAAALTIGGCFAIGYGTEDAAGVRHHEVGGLIIGLIFFLIGDLIFWPRRREPAS